MFRAARPAPRRRAVDLASYVLSAESAAFTSAFAAASVHRQEEIMCVIAEVAAAALGPDARVVLVGIGNVQGAVIGLGRQGPVDFGVLSKEPASRAQFAALQV